MDSLRRSVTISLTDLNVISTTADLVGSKRRHFRPRRWLRKVLLMKCQSGGFGRVIADTVKNRLVLIDCQLTLHTGQPGSLGPHPGWWVHLFLGMSVDPGDAPSQRTLWIGRGGEVGGHGHAEG